MPSVGTVHDFSQLHVPAKYDALRMLYIMRVLPRMMRRLEEHFDDMADNYVSDFADTILEQMTNKGEHGVVDVVHELVDELDHAALRDWVDLADDHDFLQRQLADAGLVAFLMVREDFNSGNPFPGVLPVVSVGTKRVAVNVTYIPKIDPKMVPVVFFQLKIGLN